MHPLLPLLTLLIPTCLAQDTPQHPPQAPYPDDIPYSYSFCLLDPSTSDPFLFLDIASGAPFFRRNEAANTLHLVTSDAELDRALSLSFVGSWGNPQVRDLVVDTSAETWEFLALYDDGSVGFENVSSGEGMWVEAASGSGRLFTTTVWTAKCNGELVAGEPGFDRSFVFYEMEGALVTKWAVEDESAAQEVQLSGFSLRDGPLVEAVDDGMNYTVGDEELQGRDVSPRLGVFPRQSQNDPDRRCEFTWNDETMHRKLVEKEGARPPGVNGCGSDFVGGRADGPFRSCCDGHDLCYDNCFSKKDSCDGNFRNCMVRTCDATKQGFRKRLCMFQAQSYYRIVQAIGDKFKNDAWNERCECECPDKKPYQDPLTCQPYPH